MIWSAWLVMTLLVEYTHRVGAWMALGVYVLIAITVGRNGNRDLASLLVSLPLKGTVVAVLLFLLLNTVELNNPRKKLLPNNAFSWVMAGLPLSMAVEVALAYWGSCMDPSQERDFAVGAILYAVLLFVMVAARMWALNQKAQRRATK